MNGQTSLKEKSYARRIFFAFIAIIFVILCLHLMLQYLNLNIYNEQNVHAFELSNRFDLDDESSVPTWFSQGLFLAISFAAALAAYLQANKSLRRLWGLFSAIALAFSIDEVAALHEHTLQSLHIVFFQENDPTLYANAWLIVAPVILFGALMLAWLAWRLLPKRTSIIFILAGVMVLFGAVVVDQITSTIPHDAFLSQGLMVGIEETLELVGASLALFAVLDFLEKNHRRELLGAIKQLKA